MSGYFFILPEPVLVPHFKFNLRPVLVVLIQVVLVLAPVLVRVLVVRVLKPVFLVLILLNILHLFLQAHLQIQVMTPFLKFVLIGYTIMVILDFSQAFLRDYCLC